MTKVFLASDHAGYELKESLQPFLRDHGFDPEDLGPFALDPNDDYPDFIIPLAARLTQFSDAFGIIIGMSGQGEAMVANRKKGVRTAVYYGGPTEILRLSRMHNNANILSLGAKFLTHEEAQQAAQIWLSTPFTNEERHVRRITKIDGYLY